MGKFAKRHQVLIIPASFVIAIVAAIVLLYPR